MKPRGKGKPRWILIKMKDEFAESGRAMHDNGKNGEKTGGSPSAVRSRSVDLRSNIAAEARARIVYERLINFTDDVGTKDALQFMMTREITHMKAFAAALESMGKDLSGSATVGMMVVHWAVVGATLSYSSFTRSKSAVNILFDPIAKHVFEQLPSQRNRALDMDIAFVAPTSDLESGSDDSRRMAVVGPINPFDPGEIARSGVLNCRLKVLLRSVRSHTVCNGDT
jgi:hypothetical protein